MAIDYNAGINSIDVGAHDITYSGNQGPKSPDQERQMAFDDTPGFELEPLEKLLDEYREDNNGRDPVSIDDLRRFFYNKYGPKGIAQVEQAVQQQEQQAQMQEGRGGIQMASAADPMLEEQYQQYVFEMQEQGLEPMSFEQFKQQAVAGMAMGGRVGLRRGGNPHSRGRGRQSRGMSFSKATHRGGTTGGPPPGGPHGGGGGKTTTTTTTTTPPPSGGGGGRRTPTPSKHPNEMLFLANNPKYKKVFAKQFKNWQDYKYPDSGVTPTEEDADKSWLPDWSILDTFKKRTENLENILEGNVQKKPGALGFEDWVSKNKTTLDQPVWNQKTGKWDYVPTLPGQNVNLAKTFSEESGWSPKTFELIKAMQGPGVTNTDIAKELYGSISKDPTFFKENMGITGSGQPLMNKLEQYSGYNYPNITSEQTTLSPEVQFQRDLDLRKGVYPYYNEGGIARLGYANGQRVGFRVGKGAGMEKTSDTGMAKFDFGPKDTGPKPDTSDDRFKQYAENIVNIPPPKPDPKDPDPPKTFKEKRKRELEKAKIIAEMKKIKPRGTWSQKTLFNLLPKSDMGYQYLETLEEENPELFAMLPEELKNLVGQSQPASKNALTYDQWSMLTQVPGYGEFLKERGKPGVLHGGDLKNVGERFVKYERNPDGSIKLNPEGKKIKATDKYGNVLYGYHESTGGGDGQARDLMLYPYQTASAPVDETDDSAEWQAPEIPVDSIRFAADGGRMGYAGGGIAGLRQGYFLGKLVKKITRGAKKVLKSPVGRMALLYGLGTIAGGSTAFGGAGGSWFSRLKDPALLKNLITPSGWSKGNILNPLLRSKGKGWTKDNPVWGGLDKWKLGIGAASLYPLIKGMGGDDDKDFTETDLYKRWLAEKQGWDKKFAPVGDQANWQPIRFANGGRTGYAGGGYNDDEEEENSHRSAALKAMYRRGAQEGGIMDQENMLMAGGGLRGEKAQEIAEMMAEEQYGMEFYDLPLKKQMEVYQLALDLYDSGGMATGGRVAAQEGGLMDMGGMEKDYRNEGGFVPIGGQERADDVPARLSKNEFVFTADAVRNAGGGDIDKGAEIMENLMENLEQGGKVSEDSQGLEGARDMFATSQRLEGVL